MCGYHLRLHMYRIFPSLHKVLLDSFALGATGKSIGNYSQGWQSYILTGGIQGAIGARTKERLVRIWDLGSLPKGRDTLAET